MVRLPYLLVLFRLQVLLGQLMLCSHQLARQALYFQMVCLLDLLCCLRAGK